MRIRKHAKISPLVYTDPSLKPVLQTHFCQLNQNPWDVMTFSPPSSPPPPSSQLNKSGASGIVDNSMDSIAVVEREAFNGVGENLEQKAEQARDKKTILCRKTDGRGWYPEKEVTVGSSVCEHYLSQSGRITNSSRRSTKRQVVEAEATPCRKRPHLEKASKSSSNPNDYYYYSGFGPHWGKNRRGIHQDDGGALARKVKNEQETKPSSSSQSVDADPDYVEFEDTVEEKKEKKRARKAIRARPLKSLI